jgi:hypothetical protein
LIESIVVAIARATGGRVLLWGVKRVWQPEAREAALVLMNFMQGRHVLKAAAEYPKLAAQSVREIRQRLQESRVAFITSGADLAPLDAMIAASRMFDKEVAELEIPLTDQEMHLYKEALNRWRVALMTPTRQICLSYGVPKGAWPTIRKTSAIMFINSRPTAEFYIPPPKD